eukprot:jgi/Hompol1/6350/HPOL_002030-RA
MASGVSAAGAANSSTTPKCFVLDASSPCGSDYAGFPVAPDANSVDLTSFTANMVNQIENLDNVARQFVSNYGCAPVVRPALDVMRFQVSLFCSLLVNDALTRGCTPSDSSRPLTGPLLCAAQCQQAVNTFQSVLANTTACPAIAPTSPSNVARSSDVATFQSYCAKVQTLPNAYCTLGAPLERNTCGWRSFSTASNLCSTTFKGDPCCSTLKDPNASSSSSSSTVIYIGVGVGAAVVLLIAIVGFVLYRRNVASRTAAADNSHLELQPREMPAKLHQPYLQQQKPQQPQQPQQLQQLQQQTPKYYPPPTAVSPAKIAPTEAAAAAAVAVVSAPQQPAVVSTLAATAKRTRVLHPYEPAMPDELRLIVGNDIIMVRAFDDGWALGFDPVTAKQGAFPLVCVVELNDAGIAVTAQQQQQQQQDTARPASNLAVSAIQRETESEVSLSKRTSSQIITPSDRQAVDAFIASAVLEKEREQLSSIDRRQRERQEEEERLRLEEAERQRRREERERERQRREQDRLERERRLREIDSNSASAGAQPARKPISQFLAELDGGDESLNH